MYTVELGAGWSPRGEPKPLTPASFEAVAFDWNPNGLELFASVWREARHRTGFYIVDAITGKPRVSLLQATDVESLAISRQGKLAYTNHISDKNIWKVELKDGELAGQPRPLIASTQDDLDPRFSPDGKRLVFISSRSGSQEVWVADRDGTNARRLTEMGKNTTGCPRWSPDGSRIVFDSKREGQYEVYTILASGGSPQRLTYSPGNDGLASFSRDGRSIFFMSTRHDAMQIWRMPFGGGEPAQLTKHGGRYAIESPDGRYLYYSKEGTVEERAGRTVGVWRIPVDGGEEAQVLPTITFMNFTLTAGGLYYIPKADAHGVYSIYFRAYEGRAARKILDISGQPDLGITVSPDGRTLLWGQADLVGSDLMLVDAVH